MYDLKNVYESLILEKLNNWAPISDWFREQNNDMMADCIIWAYNNNKLPYIQSNQIAINKMWGYQSDKIITENTRFWWFRLDGPKTKAVKEDSKWYKHSIPVGIASYMPKLGNQQISQDAKYVTAQIAWEALATGLQRCREVCNVQIS